MKIQYIDTDGIKGTLPEATLGYDAYPAGGDEGRVAVGTLNNGDILLAKKSEVDSLQEVTGTTTNTRYDKLLSVRDVIEMVYTGGSLTAVRYEGDNNTTVYYRDIMTYDVDGNLIQVDHYYGTADLVTASGNTALTYSGGDLATATYSE